MSDQRLHIATGPGRLIVLSGPSGVGKDTVLRELRRRAPSLRYSVSYTTRPPRPGETDGDPYSFVDEATFTAMIERDEFLEWADVHGHLYGTSLERVRSELATSADVILKIDVQGATRVRRRVDGDAIFIFLLPPSDDELKRRLVARATEDEAALAVRVANAVEEMAQAPTYDYRIVNDSVESAAQQIIDIVNATRGAEVPGDG